MNEKLKSELQSVGSDVFISDRAEIRRPHLINIGNHVAIDSGAYITTQAEIKDYIHIGPYVTIIGGEKGKLIMNDFCSIAAGARMICSSDSHLGIGLPGPTIPDEYKDQITYGIITMEMFSAVCTNAIVMPNVKLSEGSVIGAGAFVTKDTEPWTIYVGNPARPLKIRRKEVMIRYATEMGYGEKIGGNK